MIKRIKQWIGEWRNPYIKDLETLAVPVLLHKNRFWIVNTSHLTDTPGEVVLRLDDSNLSKVFVVPETWLPIDASVYSRDLLTHAFLWQAVDKKLVAVVKPRVARRMLESLEAEIERHRLAAYNPAPCSFSDPIFVQRRRAILAARAGEREMPCYTKKPRITRWWHPITDRVRNVWRALLGK